MDNIFANHPAAMSTACVTFLHVKYWTRRDSSSAWLGPFAAGAGAAAAAEGVDGAFEVMVPESAAPCGERNAVSPFANLRLNGRFLPTCLRAPTNSKATS
jgi:hypothetical protein